MMTKQRLIQLIHIARSDLQMDEDTYRQMLQGLTGKASTKGMDTTQLNCVLESMKRKAFALSLPGNPGPVYRWIAILSQRKSVHYGLKWLRQVSSVTVQSRRWRYGLNGKRASARYAGSAMSRQVALLRN
jgi:hypothetical protein